MPLRPSHPLKNAVRLALLPILAALACSATASVLAPVTPPPPLLAGQAPRSGNPILPGYYADPTVLAYQGHAYIYATIDPWGGDTLGCWESPDFRNWTYHTLNWPTKRACTSPTSLGAMVWAPSVLRGRDGKFHMVVSVGSEIWAGVADNPLGPWRNTLGNRPMIPANFRPGYHMIDAELFLDDDGQAYVYWGSGWNWVNGRCWAAKLKPDMATLDGPVHDVTPAHYFEAPILVKRHGLYFLLYSAGKTTEDTYCVRYAMGKTPFGPFVEGANSPILSTHRSENIVSPGHNGILHLGGRDYILYHRQSIPFDPRFIGRQVCIDPIVFTAQGQIHAVVPSHAGPSLVQGRDEATSLAFGAHATASTCGPHTRAGFAVDDNYATRWSAAPGSHGAWLQLDLGREVRFARQDLRFEYAWKSYRFMLESSPDGRHWTAVADFTRQPATGSPVQIDAAGTARYLRLVFPDAPKAPIPSLFEWSVH